MKNYNYQKAWFVQIKPEWDSLNTQQLNAHSKVRALIGESGQDSNGNIPLTPAIEEILGELSNNELAKLSRVSYNIGHFCPPYKQPPFDNKRGESWKVTNYIDQILRKRFDLPYRMNVNDGLFVMMYNGVHDFYRDHICCATDKNLQIILNCGLNFGIDSFWNSIDVLKKQINDLWGDPNELPDNQEYSEYLYLLKVEALKAVKRDHLKTIERLKQEVENAKLELEAFTWLIEHNIETENCIYYRHADIFCFGWREPVTEKEKSSLLDILVEFPYNYEIKGVAK